MKKIVVLALVIGMALLTACSSEGSMNKEEKASGKTEVTSQDNKETTEDDGSIEVDKGLLNVEITIPASLFEGQDIDLAIEEAKSEGVKEVIKNEDGSLTYKMSKSMHKKMMEDLGDGMQESMEEMVSSGDFASIKDITYNKDFSEFTMVVDKEAYENSMDGFAIFGLGMSSSYYHVFNGASEEDFQVTIFLEDQATGEVYDQVVLPDDLEEEEQ